MIGLGVLAIIASSERIDARIPGALIGLALASAAVVLLGLESRGVSVLGAVSVAPPALAMPDISAGRLPGLVSLSLIIAIVVMVQTAATTRSFPSEPRRAAGCRPRLRRRRRRQYPVGTDRRISGQCQPAAHRGGFRDRRPIPARRPRRRGDRDRAAGLRRLAARPNSERRARRRAAVRRPADRPRQSDRRDLPAVARRIPADRR